MLCTSTQRNALDENTLFVYVLFCVVVVNVMKEENVLDVLKLLTSLAFEEMNAQLIHLIKTQEGLK